VIKGRIFMDTNLRAEIDRLHAQVCNGLADPNRILILYTISENAYNVSELAKQVELPQSTVSRHLKILRERGMVIAQRNGQSVFYSLADDRIIQALELLRAMLASSLESQGELARSVAQSKVSNQEE
jgi:ArsR family transcriptional regulator